MCIHPCLVIVTLLTNVNVEHCGTSHSKLWKSYFLKYWNLHHSMWDILEYAHHVSENRGKRVGRVLTQNVLKSVCGVIRPSLTFYHKSRNDSIYSLSVHLLRSRKWMVGLTSAPEGACSLAKLQLIHKHLCLRSCSHWGCKYVREQEMRGGSRLLRRSIRHCVSGCQLVK